MEPLEQELVAMKIHRVTNKEGQCTSLHLAQRAYRGLLHGWLQPVDNRRLGVYIFGRYAELLFSSTRSFRPFYPLHVRQMLGGFWYLGALGQDHSISK